MNLLVLTTRNLYEDGGEKSLMFSKDNSLREKNINLYYYSFRMNFNILNKCDFNIIKKDSSSSLLLKKIQIKKNIESIIKENKIDILIISGNWILFISNELKELKEKYKIKISYDYQGAIEEIKEYKLFKNNAIISTILYQMLKYYEKKFLKIVDGIETISNNALIHLKEKYKNSNYYKSVIIHCGIDNSISYEEWGEYRKIWRDKYNLNKNDIAFVYAGGISKWQNIDEIISLAVDNFNIKLYIFTSLNNQDILKNQYNLPSNVFFDFQSHEVLQKALCAFDYGLLLRDTNITNYVAFPNKYSEYINARLFIVLKSNQIGCFPNEENKQKLILNIENISRISNNKASEVIYKNYIEDLLYKNMIIKLRIYYENL